LIRRQEVGGQMGKVPPRMEKHHIVEKTNRASDHEKEDYRGSNVNFSAARRDTRLHGKTL